jgi:hypothetical protein
MLAVYTIERFMGFSSLFALSIEVTYVAAKAGRNVLRAMSSNYIENDGLDASPMRRHALLHGIDDR